MKVFNSLFSFKKEGTLNEGCKQFLRDAIFDNIFQFLFSDTLTDVYGEVLSIEEKGHI